MTSAEIFNKTLLFYLFREKGAIFCNKVVYCEYEPMRNIL